MICTPASLDQEVGLALGAQAGEARQTAVLEQGGFTRVRRATETPFNLILEDGLKREPNCREAGAGDERRVVVGSAAPRRGATRGSPT